MRNPWVVVGLLVLGLVGCEAGLIETDEVESRDRVGGLVPDDPVAVARVPTLTVTAATREFQVRRERCGDRVCSGSETCSSCARDCGTCPPPPPACGDGVCNGTESCDTCETDCGACPPPPPACGDGVCNGTESCASCATDCGACPPPPPACGDGVCGGGETCETCEGDCGSCPAVPPAYLIDMPPAGDQGSEGACVAFAVGYAARSADHYRRTGSTQYSQSTNIFSPEYLYSQIKFAPECSSGSAMQTGLDYLKNYGITTYASVPYSSSNGCTLTPTASQRAEASAYKISGYSKILSTDHDTIKTLVASDRPVITSLLFCNEVINHAPNTGYVWKTCASGALPHAVVIVGYDEAKRAYRLLNSWGTDWGDNGYVWVDYDMFRSRTGIYVYVID